MIRKFIYPVLLTLLFWGCNRIDIYPDIQQFLGYPTVIHKLSAETLSQNRETFAANNPFLFTSLTGFGFCGYADDLVIVDTPPVRTPLTESEAKEKVIKFVSVNTKVTGVKAPSDLTFTQIFMNTDYYDGGTGWILKSANQKVDTIEVLNSQIIFSLRNRELVSCAGNWYPDIFIPDKFNVSPSKAANSLLNIVVGHSTIAGQIYYVTITSDDLDQSLVNLKILPVTTDEKIELRVCWQIDIPGPVYYKIFIDVMTGKIVEEWPTIIS